MRDENVAIKIVEALPLEGFEQVIEIGPGDGVLSKYLLDRYDNILFFDVDQESITHLKNAYPMHRDKFILQDFIAFKPTVETAVIGNFPYNISSQILFRCLEFKDRIPEVVGMFQREVAQRIAQGPGSKQYGILSVFMQAYYDIEYLFTVDEDVFDPPPKVKSGVIRCIRNERKALPCDEKLFKTVVKTAFNQRRKTLRNSLKPLLRGLELPEKYSWERPEQCSVEDFILLTELINNNTA